uniref:Uncharacterized protein n=1 Tax=Phaeomonas parva TaxID=124430 RepID=A0A7S1U3S5_9STRA|mmetsp:Transcript_27924/g.88961  ORF Transcript_27924/g.88961 Transcript_27924/m.88961 type:complete len:467 (+) Transcript_27924:154-1554(+)
MARRLAYTCAAFLLALICAFVFASYAQILVALHASSGSGVAAPSRSPEPSPAAVIDDLVHLIDRQNATIHQLAAKLESALQVAQAVQTNEAASANLRREKRDLEGRLQTALSRQGTLQADLDAMKALAPQAPAPLAPAATPKATPTPTLEATPKATPQAMPEANANSAAPRAKLVIGMQTVPRPNDLDYLGQTLRALVGQLPTDPSDPWYGMVRIVAIKVSPGPHRRFEEAKTAMAQLPGGSAVTFLELVEPPGKDPGGADPPRGARGGPNVPNATVRKQTRDIVATLRACDGLADAYLFLEDDMELCPRGFEAVRYVLEKATAYYGEWIAVRCSFGMNGIFITGDDVPIFANYLEEHQSRRPPDHLVVEWFAGEKPQSAAQKRGRVNGAFRYNIFKHLGLWSTLRSQKSPRYPACFEELNSKVLFEAEAFSAKDCPDDDLWPCNVSDSKKALIPRVEWPVWKGRG